MTETKLSAAPIREQADDKKTLKGTEGDIVATTFSTTTYDSSPDGSAPDTANLRFYRHMPADGKSVLTLRAEVLDQNGDIDETVDGTHRVQNFAVKHRNYAIFSPSPNMKVLEGVAEVQLTRLTTAENL